MPAGTARELPSNCPPTRHVRASGTQRRSAASPTRELRTPNSIGRARTELAAHAHSVIKDRPRQHRQRQTEHDNALRSRRRSSQTRVGPITRHGNRLHLPSTDAVRNLAHKNRQLADAPTRPRTPAFPHPSRSSAPVVPDHPRSTHEVCGWSGIRSRRRRKRERTASPHRYAGARAHREA
jgi:hypothetical protein